MTPAHNPAGMPIESWHVEAREAIADTLGRYTHFGDSARFDLFVEQFTEDGVLEVENGGTHRGRAEILHHLQETPARVRQTMARPMSRHFVTNTLIEFQSDVIAVVQSYFLNLSSEGLDHWGRYRTRMEKVGGRWLIAHRYARVDGQVPGSWAPPPADRRQGSQRTDANREQSP
jgi:hypothetical protein